MLNWPTLKEECPMAIQIIEKESGYTFDPIYGVLKKDNAQYGYSNLVRFFDDQGWYMSVYSLGFPNWNGVLSDTKGNQMLNDPTFFQQANSRSHAEGIMGAWALKAFEEELKKMFKLPDTATKLDRSFLIESAKEKELKDITFTDLNTDAHGLVVHANFAVLIDGKQAKVIKNIGKLPFIDMIITI